MRSPIGGTRRSTSQMPSASTTSPIRLNHVAWATLGLAESCSTYPPSTLAWNTLAVTCAHW